MTTVEMDQVKWGTFSLQLTWVPEEPLRPSLLEEVTLVPSLTTQPSIAGDGVMRAKWEGVVKMETITKLEMDLTKWGVNSKQLN